jgi:hypothetical protein
MKIRTILSGMKIRTVSGMKIRILSGMKKIILLFQKTKN